MRWGLTCGAQALPSSILYFLQNQLKTGSTLHANAPRGESRGVTPLDTASELAPYRKRSGSTRHQTPPKASSDSSLSRGVGRQSPSPVRTGPPVPVHGNAPLPRALFGEPGEAGKATAFASSPALHAFWEGDWEGACFGPLRH